MAVPDAILLKPGALTPEETATMRLHCVSGYQMTKKIPFLSDAAEIVYAHHENFDGTGYPRGLKADQIPLGARIFHVIDCFEAMISDRPYQAARSIKAAREEIARLAGTEFDPEIAGVFLDMPELFGRIYGEKSVCRDLRTLTQQKKPMPHLPLFIAGQINLRPLLAAPTAGMTSGSGNTTDQATILEYIHPLHNPLLAPHHRRVDAAWPPSLRSSRDFGSVGLGGGASGAQIIITAGVGDERAKVIQQRYPTMRLNEDATAKDVLGN